MNRLEYLKNCLQNGLANKLAWVFSAFCLVKESADEYQKNPYHFRLVNTFPQYKFINQPNTLDVIDGTSTKEPLFTFKEKVKVDSSWASNIKEPMETCIGNLIFNAVCILPTFGSKYPFPNGKISVREHEAYIVKRLTDTPKVGTERDPSKIYVDEYINFRDRLIYIEQFAPITNWSSTRKNITKPTGLEAYKKQLLEEYGERLNDPAVFAEYENKLREYDRAYLKDDPAYGTFLSGRMMDIDRKKMFLSIGIPDRLDLKDPIVPITRSLEDGQPQDKRSFTASLNGARFGSYSRGTETINGGVVSKAVIRVGSNFKTDMEDCETTLGLHKRYSKDTIKSLVGRTIVINSKSITIEKLEQAENYLDKVLVVRSPATCQAGPGDRLCKKCAGFALSEHEQGIIIPLTELSHLILNQSLKAMHGKVITTAKVSLTNVLS